MKFRTDFVTNSSDSSFLAFNIKNKKLFEALTGLGITFKSVKDGEFSDRMKIVLPSGESDFIDGGENWSLPYFSDTDSISAWLVAAILWEVESIHPQKEADEYSDFARELIDLLNNADITHLDWEAVETWSREAVITDLEKAFGSMDEAIEEAHIEHTYGFEGEVGPCLYTEIKDGSRMSVKYYDTDDIETENCEGLTFVVTGKLRFYENRDELVAFIEESGGRVAESVSKNTDYLICNDVKSASSEMKKARELGISILSEAAFIRRFGDPDEFDDLLDEDELGEEAWEVTYEGGVLDFVVDNGTQPIVMEVWQDGQWVRHISEQKKAVMAAASAARAEATKKVMAGIWAGDDGQLKRLLLIPTRDCLTTTDAASLEKLESMSYEQLCEKGYIRFVIGPIEDFEAQDCFICVETEMKKDILGDNTTELTFTVICKNELADLDGYKARHLEICSVLNRMLNNKKVEGIGNTYFMSCKTNALSDFYCTCSLWFTDNDYSYGENKDKNILEQYAASNKAVVETLLADAALREAMGLEALPVEDVYAKGYFVMHDGLAQNLSKGYPAWMLISWDFSYSIMMTVALVCRTDARTMDNGEDRLAAIMERIRAVLPSLESPDRTTFYLVDGKGKYDEIKLSDALVATLNTYDPDYDPDCDDDDEFYDDDEYDEDFDEDDE